MIDKYVNLIHRFVNGEVSASQFESLYLDLFGNEMGQISEETYQLLNNLFLDVDAYCSDPDLRDENDIDDEELLESAKFVLQALR